MKEMNIPFFFKEKTLIMKFVIDPGIVAIFSIAALIVLISRDANLWPIWFVSFLLFSVKIKLKDK